MIRICIIICSLIIHFITDAQTINTIAGNGTGSNTGDGGQAISCTINGPVGMAVDATGNIYLSCTSCIRKIDALTGTISTIAGNPTVTGGSGNNIPATSALLNGPAGIAIDGSGNIYFAEIFNHRVMKINNSGIISVVAGNGTAGFAGDGSLAITSSQLNTPNDVALDALGNIYIADAGNHRIRKINTSGTITTIAGTGFNAYSGDGGPATTSDLNGPVGVAVDASNNIYIADYGNTRIRKIDTGGTITTVVGTGVQGFSGDGGPATSAQLGGPRRIRFDSSGNLFIPDYYYGMVRKVSSSGTITTVTGYGIPGFSGDGGPAISAQINSPHSLAISVNKLYIGDFGNYRVRLINLSTGIYESFERLRISVHPNPTSDKLSVSNADVFEIKCSLFSTEGKEFPLKEMRNKEFDVSTLPEGLYFLQIQSKEGTLTRKIVVQH